MASTFGVEFEARGNGLAMLAELHRQGAVANDYLCPYHGCGDYCCDHSDTEYLFSATEDCSVSAEFPSRILTWGTERAEQAFAMLEHASVLSGADLSGDSGMHVHVEKPGVDEWNSQPEDGLTIRQRATWRLLRLFVRYQDDLDEYAQGGRDVVRGYNHRVAVSTRPGHHDLFWNADLDGDEVPMYGDDPVYGRVADGSRLASGSWLDIHRHSHTYEFRLWNATKAAWRIRLVAGLSVAMVNAAESGVDVTEHDTRSLEHVLAPWLDDEMWSGIIRQRFSKGGI